VTIEGVQLVVGALPYPQHLERVVSALADAPGEDAERVLRDLMERHPQLVSRHDWLRAIIKRGTRSAAIMLMDLVANERAGARADQCDPYWMACELVALIQRHPDLRAEVMRRYETAGNGRGQAMFEHVLAELGDADAVLALVRA